MILGKYKSKRKLGKGAYGEVLLVQDEKGKQFALKLISMKSLLKQSYLIDYLEGEIECMKQINSPYIMKLYNDEQDQNFKYLLCEYCDVGDLLNYQAKQPKKVFSLDKAVQILSEVIKGLYELHQHGYLHRDIKSQNILVKTQNGKQIFKLADFGFSKKCQELCMTVLGTENYMSPQIFKNSGYGFEVDMWAFGVLFYFMLNMQFPFSNIQFYLEINPHDSLDKKSQKLETAAKNFSYKAHIKETKKKIMENCTDEVEDLFKKIFNPNANQRITFAALRQQPIFAKYFPENDNASKILYGKKFESKRVQRINEKDHRKVDQQDNITITPSIIRKKDKLFPRQKSALETKKDQLDFLKQNALQLYQNNQFLKTEERCSLAYNLIKYYVILLRQFVDSLNPYSLGKLYPGLKWDEFCKTSEFKEIKKQAEEDKLKNQIKFEQIYDQCSYSLKEIEIINSKFKPAYDKEIRQTKFDGLFKESYRKSTHTSFNTLRGLIKNSRKSGNKLNYILVILVISHVFNHIFTDKANLEKIFSDYFVERKRNSECLDYAELREWMTKASSSQLNNLAKQIIQLYFS